MASNDKRPENELPRPDLNDEWATYVEGILDNQRKIAIEEYKALRSDLLQTRTDLQRVIVYSLALASICAGIGGRFFGIENTSSSPFDLSSDRLAIVQSILLIISGIFIFLGLNYLGNMRHYVALTNYLKKLEQSIRSSFDAISIIKNRLELLDWEKENREFYYTPLSKMVLSLTWGSQLLLPLVCGTSTLISSILVDKRACLFCSTKIYWFDHPHNKFLVFGVIFFAVVLVIGICLALQELNTEIKKVKKQKIQD